MTATAAPLLLRQDLEITDGGAGVDHVVVFDPVRSKYLRIKRAAFAALTSDAPVDAGLLERAAEMQLLATSAVAPAEPGKRRRSLGFFQLFDIDPTPLLSRLAPAIRVAAGWPGWVAGFALVAFGFATLVSHPHHVPLTAPLWLAVSCGLSVAFVLHELGHAAMVVYFGGRVRRIGIALIYLRPACVCDASAAWTFTRRRQRVLVSFAGIFTNLVIAGTCWSATWFHLPVGVEHYLVVYGAANVVLAMLNLFPFIKLDGYWMLASSIDRPNLLRHSVRDAESVLWRLFLGRRRARGSALSVAFGFGCMVAPVALIAIVLQRCWTFAGHYGAVGLAGWLALFGYVAVYVVRATVDYVASLHATGV